MVTIDMSIIAKFDKKGKHFEILVDPKIAYELKEGKNVSIQNMLAVNDIYTDSKKGEKATDSDIKLIFGTTDILKITEEIVKNGEIQLTTDFKNKKIQEKKKQIAEFISRNAINPQTKVPHPQERILNSIEQSKIHIDPFKGVEQQVDIVISSIREIIPISIEKTELTIQIPFQYSGNSYGFIKNLGDIKEQKWTNEGSLIIKMTIPSGIKEDVFRKINSMTNGLATINE